MGVIRNLSAALAAAALLFSALPAHADLIALSCSGSDTTIRIAKDGAIIEAEQKDIKDFSIVVDLEHNTVSGFWPELKLDPIYTPIPITAVDANTLDLERAETYPWARTILLAALSAQPERSARRILLLGRAADH